MSKFHYLQLDVFAASRGGGNPLGVVVDAREWTDADMQGFAAWTNLVETTFLLPPTDPAASYRLRIFTPTNEIPFAGHPTIGSAHAALHSGFAQPRDGLLVQECGAGLLPIRLHAANGEQELFVKSPAARVVEAASNAAASVHGVLAAQGLGTLPPTLIEGGRRWWVVEFADEAGVRAWQPDHAAIKALATGDNCLGVCIFARCANAPYDLVVRAFPAGVGIAEDPVTGSAHCALGPLWGERLSKTSLVVEVVMVNSVCVEDQVWACRRSGQWIEGDMIGQLDRIG